MEVTSQENNQRSISENQNVEHCVPFTNEEDYKAPDFNDVNNSMVSIQTLADGHRLSDIIFICSDTSRTESNKTIMEIKEETTTNQNDDDKNKNQSDVNNSDNKNEPEIIYNGNRKHAAKRKYLRSTRQRIVKKVIAEKIKNINFKINKSKPRCTINKLNKCHAVSLLKTNNCLNEKSYSESLSQVPHTKIVKKVSAKENLLNNTEKNISEPYIDLKVITTDSRQTHILKSSSTDLNPEFQCSMLILPDLRVPPQKYSTLSEQTAAENDQDIDRISENNSKASLETSPVNDEEKQPFSYKEEIVNIAVFHVDRNKNKCSKDEPITAYSATKSQSKVPTDRNDTKSNPFFVNPTSTVPIRDDFWSTVDEIGYSNTTLKTENESTMSSSDDFYEFAKTSSEFRNEKLLEGNKTPTNQSDVTLKVHSNVASGNKTEIEPGSPQSIKRSPLDTVIDTGMFPEMTSSKSSIKNAPPPYSKGDERHTIGDQRLYTNDSEHFRVGDKLDTAIDIELQNEDRLINEKKIIEMLKPTKHQKRTCADEFRNSYPTTLPELWDRLVFVIDLAVKQVEEKLSEKFIKELNASIAKITLPRQILTVKSQTTSDNIEATAQALSTNKNAGFQCDIVHNYAIDELLHRIEIPKTSKDNTKIFNTSFCFKPKRTKKIEYLKSPSPTTDKKDVDVIASVEQVSEPISYTRFDRYLNYITVFLVFIRENALVIGSAPTLVVMIFMLIYGLIRLLGS